MLIKKGDRHLMAKVRKFLDQVRREFPEGLPQEHASEIRDRFVGLMSRALQNAELAISWRGFLVGGAGLCVRREAGPGPTLRFEETDGANMKPHPETSTTCAERYVVGNAQIIRRAERMVALFIAGVPDPKPGNSEEDENLNTLHPCKSCRGWLWGMAMCECLVHPYMIIVCVRSDLNAIEIMTLRDLLAKYQLVETLSGPSPSDTNMNGHGPSHLRGQRGRVDSRGRK